MKSSRRAPFALRRTPKSKVRSVGTALHHIPPQNSHDGAPTTPARRSRLEHANTQHSTHGVTRTHPRDITPRHTCRLSCRRVRAARSDREPSTPRAEHIPHPDPHFRPHVGAPYEMRISPSNPASLGLVETDSSGPTPCAHTRRRGGSRPRDDAVGREPIRSGSRSAACASPTRAARTGRAPACTPRGGRATPGWAAGAYGRATGCCRACRRMWRRR